MTTVGSQPPFFEDVANEHSYHIEYLSNAGADRMRLDHASGRFQVVSADQGRYQTGARCTNGDAPNIDGLCHNVSAPNHPTNVDAQLPDFLFKPFVEGAIPEPSAAARELIMQRHPNGYQKGTVFGELKN